MHCLLFTDCFSLFLLLKESEGEMAAYGAMKPAKAGLEEPQEQIHKIRITLSSKNVKNLEKGFFFSLVICLLYLWQYIKTILIAFLWFYVILLFT